MPDPGSAQAQAAYIAIMITLAKWLFDWMWERHKEAKKEDRALHIAKLEHEGAFRGELIEDNQSLRVEIQDLKQESRYRKEAEEICNRRVSQLEVQIQDVTRRLELCEQLRGR